MPFMGSSVDPTAAKKRISELEDSATEIAQTETPK